MGEWYELMRETYKTFPFCVIKREQFGFDFSLKQALNNLASVNTLVSYTVISVKEGFFFFLGNT